MLIKYKKAEQLLSCNTQEAVLNGDISINWINDKEFWYSRDSVVGDVKGKTFIVTSCIDGTKTDAFPHEELASKINENMDSNYNHNTLPFNTFNYMDNKMGIGFKIEDSNYEYNFTTKHFKKVAARLKVEENESLSPNGKHITYVKDHNLYIERLADTKEIQLTSDGIKHNSYGSHPGSNNITVHDKIKNIKKKPGAIWSPDSKKILTYKLDESSVRELHVMQSITEDEDDLRPKIFSYRYHIPGDEYIPEANMYICDIMDEKCTKINTEPLYINFTPPYTEDYRKAEWLKDGSKVYFTRISRDFKNARFSILDTTTLEVKTIIEEKSDTFLFYDSFGAGDGYDDYGFSNRLLENGKYIIWQSARDGWAHFYLYDAKTGESINQITKGEWAVRNLVHIDEIEEWIYFTAGGKERGRDPYYLHFYKVRFDGKELTLLTSEDANHSISLSPDKSYFIDTYSRIDLPPKTVFKSMDGKLITVVEEADINHLLAMGYILPEKFSVKARDGETDLYGIMVKPANFDNTKKYPLIDYIYGGPQMIVTPKSFTWKAEEESSYLGGLQSFAQLGFIGIIMDGMGTPQRSKKIHDYSYKNLEGCAGLEDHFICTQKLGNRWNFIDMDRVGLWGVSGGGYATVRAMFEYPDFYKVGVSASGNHDQRLYNAAWVERYNGLFDKEVYDKQDNSKLAKNLKGKLLLVHGDLDDNVHISQTIKLTDALIKENKDFDFFILPNVFHNVTGNKYLIRKMWDYFVEYLLGIEPPNEYKMK